MFVACSVTSLQRATGGPPVGFDRWTSLQDADHSQNQTNSEAQSQTSQRPIQGSLEAQASLPVAQDMGEFIKGGHRSYLSGRATKWMLRRIIKNVRMM